MVNPTHKMGSCNPWYLCYFHDIEAAMGFRFSHLSIPRIAVHDRRSYAVLMSIIKAILWIYFMIYMYLIGMLSFYLLIF